MRSIFDLDFSKKRVRYNGHVLSRCSLSYFLVSLPGCYYKFLDYYYNCDKYSYAQLRQLAIDYRNSLVA